MATDAPHSPSLTPAWKRSLRRRLLSWYGKNKRDLPWRHSSNAYRVWVSEIMLQQTTVKMATPYFHRFLSAFPTVEALAAADESQVLKQWEGLGYYRRARSMYAAAKQVVKEHDGEFPQELAALQKLPGIGRYTAGAIRSMAYDLPAPILETNTVRLFARLIGYRQDPSKTAAQKVLWSVAEEVLPGSNISLFNQALMELGSLVCTPTDPHCDKCPVVMLCKACATGLQNAIPPRPQKQQFTSIREAAVVVRKNGQVLVRQCGAKERWAGLWDFPRFEIAGEGLLFVREELQAKIRDQTGISAEPGGLLTTIKHGVTRYRITLDCYGAKYQSGRVSGERNVRWVRIKQLNELPLSTTGRKISNLIAGMRK